jgi:hypothetical protein
MTVATPVTAPVERICDGPKRYNLVMALTNRTFQLFQLERTGRVARRIDAVAVFDPEVESAHQYVITVFDRDTQQTEQWFYDAQEGTGSTALPRKR